ncbi:sulfotransferase domain-containing protein [Rhizobium sp. RU20A]|uniref:sulfotransferase domain-containing protein n=1 Tax=Rhizobium sp. RU20A TaxID=1907412 RepID=UPI00122D3113|nr:sulfotransferase domain-containing protein [Rhizobium sp. RU20A]
MDGRQQVSGVSVDKKFVFLGFRRGGSSILFMLLQGLLERSGYRADDTVARFHLQAIAPHDIPEEHLQDAFEQNTLVGCFRGGVSVVEKVKGFEIVPILVVRDPRDCQLSWFHARYLHQQDALPASIIHDADIDQPLGVDDTFIDDIRQLHDFARQREGLIRKYEDVVQDPIGFLIEVAEFMGIRPDREALDLIVMEANFLQLVGNTDQHNRLGRPYEALNALSADDLKKINGTFGEIATTLGYPLTAEGLASIDLRALQSRDVYKRFAIRLARENGDRIEEIHRQQRLIEELQTENGYRIDEIRRINETLSRLHAALADGV